MTEFRPTLSGLGGGLAAQGLPTSNQPPPEPDAPALQKPREYTATKLANQILKALDGRGGWTPAGVLREAVNPINRDLYNQAIQTLRKQKLIESFGVTSKTLYRLADSMKPQAHKPKPVAEVAPTSSPAAATPEPIPATPQEAPPPTDPAPCSAEPAPEPPPAAPPITTTHPDPQPASQEVTILPVKPGSVSDADKAALRAAGVLVIEHDSPNDLRLLRPSSDLQGLPLLRAAVKALKSGNSFGAAEQRQAFAIHIAEAIIAASEGGRP